MDSGVMRLGLRWTRRDRNSTAGSTHYAVAHRRSGLFRAVISTLLSLAALDARLWTTDPRMARNSQHTARRKGVGGHTHSAYRRLVHRILCACHLGEISNGCCPAGRNRLAPAATNRSVPPWMSCCGQARDQPPSMLTPSPTSSQQRLRSRLAQIQDPANRIATRSPTSRPVPA